MKKGMSGPMMAAIVIVLLVVAYFVGQALHLDHKTQAPAAVTAAPL